MMDEIKSGKELCDEFFNGLVKMKDADQEIEQLLKELYETKKLSPENILAGLESLRENDQNEQ